MGELLVVTGPPGAGKTTLARSLAEHFEPGALVPADAFTGFLERGALTPWTPEAREQGEACMLAAAAAAGRFAASGRYVIYDGVVPPPAVPSLLDAAGVDHLHYVVLLPPEQRCLLRIAMRTGQGFTDQAATRRMHRGFAEAGLDPRHVLADPPLSAPAVAAAVLERMADGRLLVGVGDEVVLPEDALPPPRPPRRSTPAPTRSASASRRRSSTSAS